MALNERIIGAESGGHAQARNPRSSAYGPHQFLAGTWLELVQRYRPDLLQGRSRDEVLALRSNEQLSSEMSDHFNAENAAHLARQGLPADDSTLYLAHFAGPGGAAKVLQNPDKPAAQLLGADVIAANPFLKDWTGADVAAWAGRKVGWQPVAVPSAVGEPLTPDSLTPEYKADAKGEKPVIPFLTELFASAMGSGGGAAGLGGGLTGAGAGAGSNMAGLFGGENSGLLGSLFGDNPWQAMMKSNQPDPTNPISGASQANTGMLPRMPVDMTGMRAMLSQRAPLNMRGLMG